MSEHQDPCPVIKIADSAGSGGWVADKAPVVTEIPLQPPGKLAPIYPPPKLRKVMSDSSMIRTGTDKSSMMKTREIFQKRIENHEIDRLINPFSEFWGQNKDDYMDKLQNARAVWKGADKRTKLTKVDDMYGRPVEGTLTEYRGNKARDFIAKNIIECCEVIQQCGTRMSDDTYEVPFGVLFKTYERINDKLVGLLVRARRHGLLDFPGEMLYQRQDDNVIIKLIKTPKFDELNLKYIDFKATSEPPKDCHTAQ